MKKIEIIFLAALILIYVFEKPIRAHIEPFLVPYEEKVVGVGPQKTDVPQIVIANAKRPNTAPSYSELSNLISNPGFEEQLNGWDYGDSMFWSADAGYDYNAALIINAPELYKDSNYASESKTLTQCIRIDDSNTFVLGAKFRYLDKLPSVSKANKISVRWFDAPDCSGRSSSKMYWWEPKVNSSNWQALEKRELVPALGAQSVEIALGQSQSGNNSAKVIWDDIFFGVSPVTENASKKSASVMVEPDRNLIKNSGFDENDEFWRLNRGGSNWQELKNENSNWVLAARLNNPNNDSMLVSAFYQCVNIGDHQKFKFSAKVKTSTESTAPGGVSLRLLWFDDLNCKGRMGEKRREFDDQPDAQAWKVLTVDNIVPKNRAKSVWLSGATSIDKKGIYRSNWDDIYFAAVTPTTPAASENTPLEN